MPSGECLCGSQRLAAIRGWEEMGLDMVRHTDIHGGQTGEQPSMPLKALSFRLRPTDNCWHFWAVMSPPIVCIFRLSFQTKGKGKPVYCLLSHAKLVTVEMRLPTSEVGRGFLLSMGGGGQTYTAKVAPPFSNGTFNPKTQGPGR